ncbi:UTRA domain-containing protein [Sphingosinicella rhizophila]|uniref:UTRA domain-containing protein n=1 Tax=Sphingosinicella rhizophila TaxID=3050082 RepID=A0ABU3QC92_9SPHN|nr:UTRA domain-containing protein [Sphingosinicella sp. GR2756]MDT9600957.1 UTRA domain-containing protein [Sphingosinicella sp. GR2756]
MTLGQRIRHDIEARIHSGALRPGDRIPFEHELVASYGCSRATVSKALEALARGGLIERRRKAGSFVAHPHVQSAVLDVPDLKKLIAGRGETYRWQRLWRGPAPTGAISAIEMPGPVLKVEGVHHASEVPFCLETRFISLVAAPGAGGEDFEQIAPGTWLLDHMPWTRARHLIRAVEANRHQAELLAVASGAACLEIERWTWRLDMSVTHVRQLFPGSRYDLTAEFKPGPA